MYLFCSFAIVLDWKLHLESSTSWGCASIQGLEGGAQAWVVWFFCQFCHPKTTACDVWFVQAFVAGTTVLPLRFLYGALLLHLVVLQVFGKFWRTIAPPFLGLLPLNSWRCWKTRPRPLLLTTLCPERWALYWAFDNSGEVWRNPIDIRTSYRPWKPVRYIERSFTSFA